MPMIIPLRACKGKKLSVMVDYADYVKICNYQWSCHSSHHHRGKEPSYYAVRFEKGDSRHSIAIRLHHEILGFPEGLIKFMDGDGLNCRRENLQLATCSQVRQRTDKWSGVYSSKYKGVSWRKDQERWRAYITLDGKQNHLGGFESEEQAALAYDAAAVDLFGKFAKTNFEQ